MKIHDADALGLTVVDAMETAAAAVTLLLWRPPVFLPILASVSASDLSVSLVDDFTVFDSLGLDDATVARRDLDSFCRSLTDGVLSGWTSASKHITNN